MRTELLGTPVDILSEAETLCLIERALDTRQRLQHVALNVAKLVSLQSDHELRRDVISSDIVGIDGMGIVLALKLMGYPQANRVTGVDLMMDVLALSARKGFKPFFLGATREVVAQAATRTQALHPHLVFSGFHDGYFKQDEEEDILRFIQSSGADCLFIGMPTPHKERLLHRWRDRLDVPFIMGVGGAFDVLAGRVDRAPTWMQERGLEWAYRIYQEPRRMWWRYLRTNAIFATYLIRLSVGRMTGHRAATHVR
jgi:N-acetylglucosaminyldiphosphoundecaprenol N-acetyl-beta-D-mannosaminyltransferase